MGAKNTWYTIGSVKAAAGDPEKKEVEILIYEEIGSWGISASRFIRDLRALGAVDFINLRINSPGGEVFDGAAIYNLLLTHPAKVTVHIDGLAASMASVVAMAGDEVRIGENAFFMIHNPWSVQVGDASEMRSMADLLDQIGETIVTAYERRSGMDRDELKSMMNAETWLSGPEAVEKGFADSVTAPVKLAASANFAKLRAFAGVPDKLKVLADPDTWAEAEPEATEAATEAPENTGPSEAPTTPPTSEDTSASNEGQENGPGNDGADPAPADAAPPAPTPTDTQPAADPDPVAAAAAQAAEIAKICAEGGIAGRASELIARRATVEEVREIVSFAGAAKGLVDRARKIGASLTPAAEAEMTSGALTVDQVRARLFDLMVSADGRLQIDPSLSPAGALGSIIPPRNTPRIDAADAMNRFAGRVK